MQVSIVEENYPKDFIESMLLKVVVAPGGGSAKMWSSMLKKNLVWNRGSKIERLCGIVWTQNGGDICKTGCDMGSGIKITQNVCGMQGVLLRR